MGFDIDTQMTYEEGMTAYDIEAVVLAKYKKAGFTLPNRPQVHDPQSGAVVPYEGQIPHDVSELTDIQLAQHMGLLSTWLEYVGSSQTMADLAHSIAEGQMGFVAAHVRLTYKMDDEGKKRVVSERDDMVKNDRLFIQADSVAKEAEAYLAFITNAYKAATQNYKVISRRITQRGQELERGHRNEGLGAGGIGAPQIPSFPGRRVG